MELGDVVSTHHGRPVRNVLGAMLAGLMTVGIVWAIFEMKPKDTTLAWLFAVGFAVVTLVLAVVAARDFNSRLELRRTGFVYQRAGATTVVRYDEIAGASTWNVNGKPAALLLSRHTGKELRIPANLSDFDEVRGAIASRMRGAGVPVARVL